MIYLMIIWIITFLSLFFLLAPKVRLIRVGEVNRHEHIGFYAIFKPKIEYCKLTLQEQGAKIYLFLHPHIEKLFLKLVDLTHRLTFRLGQKFIRISNAVKGKGVLRNKGSASFFLKNIAEHKKRIMAQEQI